MTANIDQFKNQNYLNLETFRKNGDPVRTPVWFVYDPRENVFYTRTASASGKVKRIRNNPIVNIMPCGQAGEPMGEWVPARAAEKNDEATAALVRVLLIEKYGDLVAMFEARNRASGFEYTILAMEIGA